MAGLVVACSCVGCLIRAPSSCDGRWPACGSCTDQSVSDGVSIAPNCVFSVYLAFWPSRSPHVFHEHVGPSRTRDGGSWVATSSHSRCFISLWSHLQELVLDDTLSGFTRQRERVDAELSICQSLRHPNIVSYLGHGMTEEYLHIYLEYVPGGSMLNLLAQFGPLESAALRKATRGTLEGLDYLHTHSPPIVHRPAPASATSLPAIPSGRAISARDRHAAHGRATYSFGGRRWITYRSFASWREAQRPPGARVPRGACESFAGGPPGAFAARPRHVAHWPGGMATDGMASRRTGCAFDRRRWL